MGDYTRKPLTSTALAEERALTVAADGDRVAWLALPSAAPATVHELQWVPHVDLELRRAVTRVRQHGTAATARETLYLLGALPPEAPDVSPLYYGPHDALYLHLAGGSRSVTDLRPMPHGQETAPDPWLAWGANELRAIPWFGEATVTASKRRGLLAREWLSPATYGQAAAQAATRGADAKDGALAIEHDAHGRWFSATWRPSTLALGMTAGTVEPRSATGLTGSGQIPPHERPHVVAAFNGGFQAVHGQWGMRVDNLELLPARAGAATVAIAADGRRLLEPWSDALTRAPLVAFRQNLPPLVEHGTSCVDRWQSWGATPAGQRDDLVALRSGLCRRADDAWTYLQWRGTPSDLAQAMVARRCVFGMALDLNEGLVRFEEILPGSAPAALRVFDGAPPETPRKPTESRFLGTFGRDFFFLTAARDPARGGF
jgi:hypothetical protein